MKHVMLFLLSLVLIFSFSSIVFTQTRELPRDYVPQLNDNSIQSSSAGLFQVGEVKGTVKNKGVYLPKPEYPSDAISADAEGEVRVKITIDDEGNVSSANATTGHQSLKEVCEDTARRTKFRIFRVDGQPVKTTGELVYRFEIKKAGWIQIGANFSGYWTQKNFTYTPILKAFASDWSEEREMLERIAKVRRDREKHYPVPALQTPTLVRTTTKSANGSTMTGVVASRRLSLPDLPTPEETVVFQQLIASIRIRLSNDEPALWQFNLGVALSSVYVNSRAPSDRAETVELFRDMVKHAPKSISPATLSDLQTLATKIESQPRSDDVYREMGRLINRIINN